MSSDIIKKMEKIEEVAKNADFVYSSALGTYIKNKIPASDNTARPGFKGERHAILRLPNGKMGIANYAGPGTHIIQRLIRNDPPRSYVDKVAKKHDIEYALSTFEPNEQMQLRDIRLADEEMIRKLQKTKKDNLYNISIGLRLIQGKKMLEDVGFMKKNTFTGKLGMYNNQDKAILLSALSRANK
jgi:hypothetical protein